MTPPVVIALLVFGVILIWIVITVNRFVRLRQHMRESWADIDVELKRRYDLIPNLVEAVKAYARHERTTLERVIELRNRAAANSGSASSQASDESQLMIGLKQLFALAEGYPELQADQQFLDLQRQLALTEDRIAAARRFYNGNARTLNVLRKSIPTSVIGWALEVEPASFFELTSDAERVVPRLGIGD